MEMPISDYNDIEKISKEHRLYESANQNYKMGLDALRRCDYGDCCKKPTL